VRSLVSIIAVSALAGLSFTGCTKSSSTQGSSSASGAGGTAGVSAVGDPVRGKQLFTQNCASCHGADGTQGGIGPSLSNEKARKDATAAIAWIKNPRPPMPKLYPSPLSDKDVGDVAAYVETL
jgi:mono/diheme cytochrome c family protein